MGVLRSAALYTNGLLTEEMRGFLCVPRYTLSRLPARNDILFGPLYGAAAVDMLLARREGLDGCGRLLQRRGKRRDAIATARSPPERGQRGDEGVAEPERDHSQPPQHRDDHEQDHRDGHHNGREYLEHPNSWPSLRGGIRFLRRHHLRGGGAIRWRGAGPVPPRLLAHHAPFVRIGERRSQALVGLEPLPHCMGGLLELCASC